MPTGTASYAASVARGSAGIKNSAEWRTLSKLMCWDAVFHCAFLAGIIDHRKFKLLKGHPNRLVAPQDPIIGTAREMRAVPAGHAIAFFEKDGPKFTMIHAMVSVGGGSAAGNKNNCIGVGKVLGWEVLDLADKLAWKVGGNFTVPGLLSPKRDAFAHHRSLLRLKTG